jgi:hypothetical protein
VKNPSPYGASMTRSVRAAAAALLAVLAPSALAQSPEYEPTGEIRFRAGGLGGGASFSADRVVGANVNMTRRDDGGWAGDLLGRDLDLHLDSDRLTGPNVNLGFSQKGDAVSIEGLFFGQRVRLQLDLKKAQGRMGGCSLDMKHLKAAPVYRGSFGCMGANARFPTSGIADLQFYGDAAAEKPPLPQLTLALVATLLT